MRPETTGNGEIESLRRLIEASERIVALTGAGISTESGIPDFRGPNGIWRHIQPITFQEFVASEEARLEDWRRRFAMNEKFSTALPNAGHHGLVRLAEEGRLKAVITQNIDGLHQRAGLASDLLVEIHGNSTRGRCIACGASMTLQAAREMIDATGASPRCGCGGVVKAAIISFGERVPDEVFEAAGRFAERADLFIVLGSSLLVHPAASLPIIAKRSGAKLVIVNQGETPFDHHAELVVDRPIGSVFAALYPQLVKSTFSNV
jgi:NAD-dependent deacetylase